MAWLRSTRLGAGILTPDTGLNVTVPAGHRYVLLDAEFSIPDLPTTYENVLVTLFLIGSVEWQITKRPTIAPAATNSWCWHWKGRRTINETEALIANSSYSAGMLVVLDGWDLLLPTT